MINLRHIQSKLSQYIFSATAPSHANCALCFVDPADMYISFSIFRHCKCLARSGRCDAVAPISTTSIINPICEAYTNAFRTESYHDLWAQVLDLTLDHGAALKAIGSSSAAGFPSQLALAEHLLSPNQSTVAKMLSHVQQRSCPEIHILLSEYYSETSEASLLCALLLKHIDQTRRRHRSLNTALRAFASNNPSSNDILAIGDCITQTPDPFNSLDPSQSKLRSVQESSAGLLKRLESGRKKARARRRFANRLKRALTLSAIVVVATSSVVGACLAMHTVVALIALPAFASASARMGSARRMDREVALLDAATKGAYILKRDLDTISRLLARLQDEAEHVLCLLRLCEWQDGHQRRRLTQEVVRQIYRSLRCFNQQLDELEEHLYLWALTINKARRLVTEQLLAAN